MKKWQLLHRIIKLKSDWVTVYADEFLDDTGQKLEYWHYERPDSAVAIVIQKDKVLLPAPQYRVGTDEIMTDFAGSRIGKSKTPREVALTVVDKELGFKKKDILEIKSVTRVPFAVDSSFSSQRLHGFIVKIKAEVKSDKKIQVFKLSELTKLRSSLRCAQCRLVIDEYILSTQGE